MFSAYFISAVSPDITDTAQRVAAKGFSVMDLILIIVNLAVIGINAYITWYMITHN